MPLSYQFSRNSLKLLKSLDKKTTETLYKIEGKGYTSIPTWSPDGSFLAFSYGDSPRLGDLYIFNLQTHNAIKITENKLNGGLAWSPRGNIIAVERREPDKFQITLHLVSTDGKCDVEVPNLENPSSPTWSPNGEKLAFIGVNNIYILDLARVLGRDIYQSLCQ